MKLSKSEYVKAGDPITSKWANELVGDVRRLEPFKAGEYNRARQNTPFSIDDIDFSEPMRIVLHPGYVIDESPKDIGQYDDHVYQAPRVWDVTFNGEFLSTYPAIPIGLSQGGKLVYLLVQRSIDGEVSDSPTLMTVDLPVENAAQAEKETCDFLFENSTYHVPHNESEEYLADARDYRKTGETSKNDADWTDPKPSESTNELHPLLIIWKEPSTETIYIHHFKTGHVSIQGGLYPSHRNGYNRGEGCAVLTTELDENDWHQKDGEPFDFRRVKGDNDYEAINTGQLKTCVFYRDYDYVDDDGNQVKDEQATIKIEIEEPDYNGSCVFNLVDCDDTTGDSCEISWQNGFVTGDMDRTINIRRGVSTDVEFVDCGGDVVASLEFKEGVLCSYPSRIRLGDCGSGSSPSGDSGTINLDDSPLISANDGIISEIADTELETFAAFVCDGSGNVMEKTFICKK